MIIDELAAHTPLAHDTLRRVHCIRVPWYLWPNKSSDYTWSERETVVTTKLVPHQANTDGQEVVSWRELHPPFDQFVLVSTYNDPCVLYVDVGETSILTPHGDMLTKSVSVLAFVQIKGLWVCMPFQYFIADSGVMASIRWGQALQINRDGVLAWYGLGLRICGSTLSPDQQVEFLLGADKYSDLITGQTADSLNVGHSITAAVALLSCKNVHLEEVCPNLKLQRQREKRGRLPLYRYHVLSVRLGEKRSVRNGHGGAGESVALHWVRGHFKRYTDDNKLFGKHTGLYWWQPHVAGTAERIVDKDYELVAEPLGT